MISGYEISGKDIENIKISNAFTHNPGVTVQSSEYIFAVASKSDNIKLHIRSVKDSVDGFVVQLNSSYKQGDVFSFSLSGRKIEGYAYYFEDETGSFCDPYARRCIRIDDVCEKKYAGIIFGQETHVMSGRRKSIPANELIMYKLHVRGFTKDRFSKVKNKGCFSGVAEKIPYMKDLGINAVELMPAYEFFDNKEVHNFWGYSNGLYFTPKIAYCSTKDPVKEFGDMVNSFHENGMDVYMEMFFPADVPVAMTVNCLRYWHEFYGVDGFHLICDERKISAIAEDAFLTDIKILATSFNETYENTHLIEYHNGFLEVARRLIKGDEGMLQKFIDAMKKNPSQGGIVNYIANNNGFTLNDVYSYDRKHNEENGEGNRDGSDYNISWNCGVEGPTRKKSINELRQLLARNAMAMLMTAQGIPLIYAGDEFLNSQNGNNNAYCQDNETGWVNWNQCVKNSRFRDFVRELIEFRKGHKCLHMENEPYLTDFKHLGQPDVSYHGCKAWYPDLENYNRHIGILTCGAYTDENEDVYVLYNMHWEPHDLALPVRKDGRWKIVMSTGRLPNQPEEQDKCIEIAARTIVILVSEKNS